MYILLLILIFCYIFQSTLYLQTHKANVDSIKVCEHYMLFLQTVSKIVSYVKGVITPNKTTKRSELFAWDLKNTYFGQVNSSNLNL